jgi:hypothetical protein
MLKEQDITELESAINKILNITNVIYTKANNDKDYSDLNVHNDYRQPSRALLKFNNNIKRLRVSLITAKARLELIPIKIEQ